VITGTTLAAAARLMDSHGVKRLPVVDDDARLIGIVSRGDLLKTHLRPDDEIEADLAGGALRDVIGAEAAAVTAAVTDGVVTLTGKVDRWSTTAVAERVARQVPGVVEVVDKLRFDYDDREVLGAGIPSAIA